MRKFITLVLLAFLFNPPTAYADVAPREAKVCMFQGMQRGKWTNDENVRTIKCFARKFGVSVDQALYVAYRESRYNEWAFNDSSNAAGLYQHLLRYWAARADSYPNWQRWMRIRSDCWCNPRINAFVTVMMVREGGWGPWQ